MRKLWETGILFFAAAGFWGMVYPDFCFVPDVCKVEYVPGEAQEEGKHSDGEAERTVPESGEAGNGKAADCLVGDGSRTVGRQEAGSGETAGRQGSKGGETAERQETGNGETAARQGSKGGETAKRQETGNGETAARQESGSGGSAGRQEVPDGNTGNADCAGMQNTDLYTRICEAEPGQIKVKSRLLEFFRR